jgi:hypothetical protein
LTKRVERAPHMVPCPTGRTREETERIMRNRKDGNPARPAAPVVHAEPWGGGGALRDDACRRSAPRRGAVALRSTGTPVSVSSTLWLDPSTKPLRAHHMRASQAPQCSPTYSHSQTVPAFHWPDSVHPAVYQTEHSVLILRSAPACGLSPLTILITSSGPGCSSPSRPSLRAAVGVQHQPPSATWTSDVVDSRFCTFTCIRRTSLENLASANATTTNAGCSLYSSTHSLGVRQNGAIESHNVA